MALDPVTAALDLGGKLIDRLWPNPEERDAAKLKLVELQQNGELAKMTAENDLMKAQADVNKTEALSTNLFVSGWRPFVGWICGSGLAIQFIVNPIATWIAGLCHHALAFPTLDMGTITMLLFGMLGIGGMRTIEKIKGVA